MPQDPGPTANGAAWYIFFDVGAVQTNHDGCEIGHKLWKLRLSRCCQQLQDENQG